MKRILAVFAVLFLAAAAAAPQADRVQLLRAEYGARGSSVDVTDRVRSLVRDGVLSIRVDNDTLGGDPAPGLPKTLRLIVRDESGSERVFTYAERESFNLNVRRDRPDSNRDRDSGPGNAPAAPPAPAVGGLRILRADYGSHQQVAEVTSRLAARIRGDSLSLRVTNDSMGGDPAEGEPKVLYVWYSFGGKTARAAVNENDLLTLPSDNDTFSGGLRIMRAQYGAGHRYADVTELLNSQIQGDQLRLRVNNSTMGGDPDPERPKQLVVFYIFNAASYRATVPEKSDLFLPGGGAQVSSDSANQGDQLQILNASYGAGDRRRDVTSIVASQVQGNTLQLVVNNGVLGGDPVEGQAKRLRIVYLWRGLRNQVTAAEGEQISIP